MADQDNPLSLFSFIRLGAASRRRRVEPTSPPPPPPQPAGNNSGHVQQLRATEGPREPRDTRGEDERQAGAGRVLSGRIVCCC